MDDCADGLPFTSDGLIDHVALIKWWEKLQKEQVEATRKIDARLKLQRASIVAMNQRYREIQESGFDRCELNKQLERHLEECLEAQASMRVTTETMTEEEEKDIERRMKSVLRSIRRYCPSMDGTIMVCESLSTQSETTYNDSFAAKGATGVPHLETEHRTVGNNAFTTPWPTGIVETVD